MDKLINTILMCTIVFFFGMMSGVQAIQQYQTSLIYQEEKCSDLTQYLETVIDHGMRFQMYNRSIKDDVKLNGVYYHDQYYCVWVEGREDDISEIDPYLSDIQETAIHEWSHHLISNNKEHFCEHDPSFRGVSIGDD